MEVARHAVDPALRQTKEHVHAGTLHAGTYTKMEVRGGKVFEQMMYGIWLVFSKEPTAAMGAVWVVLSSAFYVFAAQGGFIAKNVISTEIESAFERILLTQNLVSSMYL